MTLDYKNLSIEVYFTWQIFGLAINFTKHDIWHDLNLPVSYGTICDIALPFVGITLWKRWN